MPIYEYQCKNCGHHLEALQKMSDPALQECPECHRPDLVKQVSKVAFQLKGDGWYVTDFRDKDKKKPETAPANAETKSEQKTEAAATTETKPSADTKPAPEKKPAKEPKIR